jgi:hypothetical protein
MYRFPGRSVSLLPPLSLTRVASTHTRRKARYLIKMQYALVGIASTAGRLFSFTSEAVLLFHTTGGVRPSTRNRHFFTARRPERENAYPFPIKTQRQRQVN